MTIQLVGLGWVNWGLVAGTLSIVLGACGGIEVATPSSSGNGGTPTETHTSTTASADGGAASAATTSTAMGGTPTSTTTPVVAKATPCPGIPATEADVAIPISACNGFSSESESIPVDIVILVDRSMANSHAVGSDSATPAGVGELRRWDVLISTIEALATSPNAQWIGASITFFGMTGAFSEIGNCSAADYAQPTVPLDLLSKTGPQIVAAMRSQTPAGVSPTVPALTGAFQYAVAEKQKDSNREKVLVLISDGFPTQCPAKSPSDVANVIAEAAAAPIPIRTLVVGIGSPASLAAAKSNLESYARAGDTNQPPILIDETTGINDFPNQLITSLLNMQTYSLACEYAVAPPDPDWRVDPNQVVFTYQPPVGDLQAIPRVANLDSCASSPSGGWYYDDPLAPTKITVCPCSCANFGNGKITAVWGCKPMGTIE